MSTSSEAQRLIALSLGKIAMSRQQRGGINLHKNLLVASVLHKARTTYMMDNFQTLLANRQAQAEREAAAKMIVEVPCGKKSTGKSTMDLSYHSRGVTDCNKASVNGVPHGECPETRNRDVADKENCIPAEETRLEITEKVSSENSDENDKKSSHRDLLNYTPVVTGKIPLSQNNGNTNYVSQLSSCRCAGSKRRRSFVDYDSVTEPKKPRFEDYEKSESESANESDSGDNFEQMQTSESTQVKSLVDIFSSGFNGLCKDKGVSQQQSSGHINVYVSSDMPLNSHQYVLKDLSCGTQIKDNVSMHTAIALAV